MAATPRRAETKLNALERDLSGSMASSTGLVEPIMMPVRRVKEPKERRQVQYAQQCGRRKAGRVERARQSMVRVRGWTAGRSDSQPPSSLPRVLQIPPAEIRKAESPGEMW